MGAELVFTISMTVEYFVRLPSKLPTAICGRTFVTVVGAGGGGGGDPPPPLVLDWPYTTKSERSAFVHSSTRKTKLANAIVTTIANAPVFRILLLLVIPNPPDRTGYLSVGDMNRATGKFP